MFVDSSQFTNLKDLVVALDQRVAELEIIVEEQRKMIEELKQARYFGRV